MLTLRCWAGNRLAKYVMEIGDVPCLRSPGKDMSILVRHSLDVMGFSYLLQPNQFTRHKFTFTHHLVLQAYLPTTRVPSMCG